MKLLFLGFWSIGFLCGTAFWIWRFTDIFRKYAAEREDLIKKVEQLAKTATLTSKNQK